VYVAEEDSLDPPLPQPRIVVLEHVVRTGGYDTVLFSTSVLATDVAAGLSARLDAGLNWDLIDVVERGGELVGTRLALQDTILVEVGWRSEHRIGMFRRGSFDVVASPAREPEIDVIEVEPREHSRRATIVGHTPRASEGPSIVGADVIVAGGIGLGGAEHFALAEQLASVLGGAVGATRAAVYKGWYPSSAQIGQTGKTVAPRLYVALGISGAVQHKVGMQNSKVIVAINKDTNAPIFEFSDLGVVGDVHTVVPKLIGLLRQHKGG
ncbi:MAG: electron transfer flavoprotein subunit alpha/FixB family protein, partial [Acidimicrobiales bacterium]